MNASNESVWLASVGRLVDGRLVLQSGQCLRSRVFCLVAIHFQ